MKQIEINFEHGGEIYGKDIELDFSVNTNPLGMPEKVKELLRSEQLVERLSAYPDNECTRLRQAIAVSEKMENPGQILCGNGATDLIYRVCYALRPKKVLLTAPCFSEYEKAARAVSAHSAYYYTKEEELFELDYSFLKYMRDIDPEVIFISNPGNPMGTYVPRPMLERIIRYCNETGCHLVVDECFLPFTDEEEKRSMKRYALSNPFVHVIKAFTKTYAMAGLRLGYMISSNEELISEMKKQGACWNVSIPAQEAGICALSCEGYLDKTRDFLREERARMLRYFEVVNVKAFEAEANYLLFLSTHELYDYAISNKILLRHCGTFKNMSQGYYRVAVKTEEENDRLFQMLKKSKGEISWQRF